MLLLRHGPGQGSIGRQLLPDEVAPVDGEVVKGGWDHAHCELCWTKISAEAENQRDGYTDGKAWLCTACFEAYIAPRLNH